LLILYITGLGNLADKIQTGEINVMNNVRPKLTMMSHEQVQEAHQNMLKVLSETGARSARQVLREKTQDLMKSAPMPEEYDEFIAKGEQFINERFKV
jgi:hypothetical protein